MNYLRKIVLTIALLSLALAFSTPLAITTSTASTITNYYQDFASCSCDITPSLCDNYCCCDSQCVPLPQKQTSTSTWTATNLCLSTSSSIQVPCGQSTNGYGAIQDLACVYTSNRGTIGYYYQSPSLTSITAITPTLFASVLPSSNAEGSVATALGTLSLGSAYTATNQYLKTSTTAYFYVPLPGIGGACTPGLVNFTTSGTYTCKITPTAQNCATINSAYSGTFSICTKGDCSTTSSSFTAPTATLVTASGVCQNVVTGYTLSGIIGYSGGTYNFQTLTVNTPSTNPSATLNTALTVTVTISFTTANTAQSGNPGYLQGSSIKMTTISGISDTTTGVCATVAGAASNAAISVPFNVKKTVSCSSPTPCASSYYIDSLSNLSITLNKYASQSTETITVGKSISVDCKAESYTLTVLYSVNGWLLDPQYYIVSALLTASPTPDKTDPSTKYLTFDWIYVDPETVSTPPQNTFYTYFSYLWTPLKQKFGLS